MQSLPGGDLLLRRTGKNLMRLYAAAFVSSSTVTTIPHSLMNYIDETLFTAVLNNDDHVLRYILPGRRNNTYCLRPKRHELTLATRRDSRNFFQRLLFKDMC